MQWLSDTDVRRWWASKTLANHLQCVPIGILDSTSSVNEFPCQKSQNLTTRQTTLTRVVEAGQQFFQQRLVLYGKPLDQQTVQRVQQFSDRRIDGRRASRGHGRRSLSHRTTGTRAKHTTRSSTTVGTARNGRRSADVLHFYSS